MRTLPGWGNLFDCWLQVLDCWLQVRWLFLVVCWVGLLRFSYYYSIGTTTNTPADPRTSRESERNKKTVCTLKEETPIIIHTTKQHRKKLNSFDNSTSFLDSCNRHIEWLDCSNMSSYYVQTWAFIVGFAKTPFRELAIPSTSVTTILAKRL